MASQPQLDPHAPLTRLDGGQQLHGLFVAPIYHQRGYPEALRAVWVRVQVATRLAHALPAVLAENYGLLIWDGWRPADLQAALWHEYREELARQTGLEGEELDRRAADFVSAPDGEAIPPHVTGGAVDLTLCTLDGQALDMGGDFDELSDRSHPDFYERAGLSPEEQRFRDRRRLLLRAMSAQDFWRLPTEWWHFEYGTASWAGHVGGQPLFGEAPAPPD